MSNKRKVIRNLNLPTRLPNPWFPFVAPAVVSYHGYPEWVSVVLVTLWLVLLGIGGMRLMSEEQVDIFNRGN